MTIVWNIDKQPLSQAEDSRYEIKEEVGNKKMSSEITILSAERRDSALFTCLVTNAFGRDDLNIRLIVHEPPEPPREVRLLDQKSRSAKLSWSLPYNGNSAITKYIITCKLNGEKDVNVTVSNDETTTAVRGLRPAKTYKCQVQAENSVGIGEPSEIIPVTTTEEVPGGPPLMVIATPLDSQSVKITWRPPEEDLWNGPIRGYYIGYKVYNSEEPYLYKTLEIGEGKKEEVTLQQLHKYTRYNILVQAYNSVGAGPRSDEITVRTSEDVPSQAPIALRCIPVTSQTLHITWEAPPHNAIHGILQGYKLLYKLTEAENDGTQNYVENLTQGQEVKLSNLRKFTNYTIKVSAYTMKGHGLPTEPVHCRTLEDVPGAPADIKAIVMSSDTILLSWRPVEKPNGFITKYSLFWRNSANGVKNATVVRISPSQTQHKVSGLRENSRHEFWLSASTSKGEGEPTRVVSQTTTRRVPARIVSFNEKVTANSADKLSLTCHAVGVQPITKEWKNNGEKIPKSERVEITNDGYLMFRKIQTSDSGNYTCHVINQHGADEITYTLHVRAITYQQAQAKIVNTGSNSVQIELPHATNNHSVKGYEVHFKAERGEWKQHRVSSRNHNFILDSLECGTRHQLYVVTFVAEGRAERSDPVTFRTQGTIPIAPKKEELVTANASHIFLHLTSWHSGGCQISHVSIEYRPHNQVHWNVLTNHISPEEQHQLVIPNLVPDTWYALRVTAYNSAGSTIAEYDVLTVNAAIVHHGINLHPAGEPSTNVFDDMTTIVSMLSSLVVLIAGAVAVACLVIYKRRRIVRHHYRGNRSSGDASSRSDVATTTSLMANLEKKQQRSDSTRHCQNQNQSHSQNRELPSYFSSPIRKVVPSNNVPSARPLNSPSTSRNKQNRNSIITEDDYEDEITPYATFRLPTSTAEEDENPSEEFKTFSLMHGEPSYMLKTSLDAPLSKGEKEELYRNSQVHEMHLFSAPNSHSLTSGSSNQEELMRAYEYARRHPSMPLHYDSSSNRNQSRTSGAATTESDATDPGIRQFSGTPPRPNERRQGACLTPGISVVASAQSNDSSTSEEATPVNTPSQPRSGGLHSAFTGVIRERSRNWGVDGNRGLGNANDAPRSRGPSVSKKTAVAKAIKKGYGTGKQTQHTLRLSSDESDSEGTLYTFSCTETPAARTSSGNELSETESDRDRLTRISSRGAFSRRPPLRTRTKTDVIDC